MVLIIVLSILSFLAMSLVIFAVMGVLVSIAGAIAILLIGKEYSPIGMLAFAVSFLTILLFTDIYIAIISSYALLFLICFLIKGNRDNKNGKNAKEQEKQI